MAKLNAAFYDDKTYKDDFIVVLEHLLGTFYTLMRKKKYSKSQLTNEEQIRNALCEILDDKQTRSTDYLFIPEKPKFDEQYVDYAYYDIAVTNVKHFLERKEEDYIIECKRLNGGLPLNRQYLTKGVMRFVSGKYVSKHKTYGMIGFLVEKKFDAGKNIIAINKIAKEERIPVEFAKEITRHKIDSYNFTYHSTHKGGKQIYHLMFDIIPLLK